FKGTFLCGELVVDLFGGGGGGDCTVCVGFMSSTSSRDYYYFPVGAQKLWLFISGVILAFILFRRWWYCGLASFSAIRSLPLSLNLCSTYIWFKLCRKQPGYLGKLKSEILFIGIGITK
ncbi:hypothetical protein KI387_011453, partial [Taxus chinensis]